MKNILLLFFLFANLSISAQDLYLSNQITETHFTFSENNWNEISQDYYRNDEGERLIDDRMIDGEAGMFLPERAALQYHYLETVNVEGDLVINELMASNDVTMPDQDDEYDDWIELYNNTNSAISMNGYFLSDDENDLTKWTFPDVTIAANDYLMIWADDDLEQAGLHTNFKLSANGETLLLVSPDGSIVDEVTFGEQTTDISFGRFPNGTGDFRTMTPTFNASNSNMTATTEIEDATFFIKMSPNPTSNWLEISVENREEYPLDVYDVNGKLIRSDKIRQAKRLWMGDLEKGIYFIKIGNIVKQVAVI